MSLQRFIALFLIFMFALFQPLSQDVTDKSEDDLLTFEQEPAQEIELLRSEKLSVINEKNTKITIKCNAPSANVYLNGQYEGKTTLVLNNLAEGRYTLRIEKEGWETKRYRIEVRRGQEETFYIELRRYEGLVSFKTEQAETDVFVDGEKIDYDTLYLPEGKHLVEAKKFGYKSKSQEIFVFRNTHQIISINLETAPFAIRDFRANKTTFNPSLPGKIGSISFSFNVTAKGKTVFKILDKDKNVILSSQLEEFTTWVQSVNWDGKSNGYFAVEDGLYTAVLESDGIQLSLDFYADSSIKVPYAGVTAGGLGIGSSPQAFRLPRDTKVLSIEGGAILSSSNNLFYASPITLSFAYSLLDFLEFSARAGSLAGYEKNSLFFNTAIKFAFENRYDNFNFDSAVFFRLGGAQNKPFAPYGADNGSGAGGGLAFGLDFSHFYAGLSSEFTYASSTYATKDKNYDSVLKNTLALQVKQESFSVAVYGAVHTSFNTTGLEDDTRKKGAIEWTRAIESGFDLKIRPFTSMFFITVRASAEFFDEQKYFRAETGILTFL